MQCVGKDSQRSTFLLPMVALFDEIVPIEVQLEHDIEGPTIISIPAVYFEELQDYAWCPDGSWFQADCESLWDFAR